MSSRSKRAGRGMKSSPVARPVPIKPVAIKPVSARPAVRTSRPVGGPSKAGVGFALGRRNGPLLWIAIVGTAAVVVAVLAVTVLRPGTGGQASARPSASSRSIAGLGPPNATPLANPPAEPASSGVTATITTSLGAIVIQVYDQSAPVAATNFLNLAQAGFYNGVTFHRLVPGFVIQGGDPAGNGSGGPGYSIQDEPVVGDYTRGMVAMARTSQPNSQGSQFFIVLDDAASTRFSRTYVIFGKVTQGMDVADQIAAMPNSGSASGNAALDPVAMTTVTVTRP